MIDDDKANNIVTKQGRSDQTAPMKLHLDCDQEPFPNKIYGQTTCYYVNHYTIYTMV